MRRILGISSMALLLGLAACGGNDDKEKQLEELKAEQVKIEEQIAALEAELKAEGKTVATEKKTVPVTVEALSQDTFRHYLEVQGKVDFDQNVLVSAKVPGVLTSVRVERGNKVSKGQTMATIDAQVLEQNLAEVRTRLDLAKIAYEKQKNLWDQKIGTEMQYLTAKNNKEALERSLATLQQQRDQYNIKAPISGVVDDVIPNSGESVAPGMGIIRVVNTQGGKIVAEVSEAYQAKINKGDDAVVFFPDLNKEIETKVDVVGNFINPTSRTFTVELRLKNGNEVNLKPNMVAVVRIQDYKNEGTIVLPVNLVQRDEKTEYVYVAKKEGDKYVAARKEIKTGMTYKGNVEVLSGLTADDQVITAGYQSVNEGQPVVFTQNSLTQK
ncbi:efflux RND transporter periplasmic adaptor subunit [Pontibacter cellulosilyticus]|uniref:Efflux RND transporter periplasmic adaptor subunit n=1 Tax=Pontibacter cellulosilyticus TaxID=1720253 RepID=A0A923SKK8_9BACT|nr:efflux RND transporter periplasmic adaptor subunit [Pontibacter cellulosilyticus]MBC5994852.1 efflux RND transporter periplasmic adaptor subunit [Pontibacter cellulosilyticus]